MFDTRLKFLIGNFFWKDGETWEAGTSHWHFDSLARNRRCIRLSTGRAYWLPIDTPIRLEGDCFLEDIPDSGRFVYEGQEYRRLGIVQGKIMVQGTDKWLSYFPPNRPVQLKKEKIMNKFYDENNKAYAAVTLETPVVGRHYLLPECGMRVHIWTGQESWTQTGNKLNVSPLDEPAHLTYKNVIVLDGKPYRISWKGVTERRYSSYLLVVGGGRQLAYSRTTERNGYVLEEIEAAQQYYDEASCIYEIVGYTVDTHKTTIGDDGHVSTGHAGDRLEVKFIKRTDHPLEKCFVIDKKVYSFVKYHKCDPIKKGQMFYFFSLGDIAKSDGTPYGYEVKHETVFDEESRPRQSGKTNFIDEYIKECESKGMKVLHIGSSWPKVTDYSYRVRSSPLDEELSSELASYCFRDASITLRLDKTRLGDLDNGTIFKDNGQEYIKLSDHEKESGGKWTYALRLSGGYKRVSFSQSLKVLTEGKKVGGFK